MPDNTPAIVSSFKSDIAAHLESESVGPGKFGAIDWAALLGRADDLIQRFAPTIEAFTPQQYSEVVALVAGLVHKLHGLGGGATNPVSPPTPPPA